MKWKIGDILRHKSYPRIRYLIVSTRETGYTWIYAASNEKDPPYFYSEDSNDPLFEIGWEKTTIDSEHA